MIGTVEPWNLVAEGYAQSSVKLFPRFAEIAMELAGISKDSAILDVACGSGTLPFLATDKVKSVHAIDFSESMINIFRHRLKQSGVDNIEIHCRDGQQLPFDDEMFDIAFSMFGLMFFPDRSQGYAEIYRTLKPGGKILLSSWAPVADSPLMQVVFGAVKTLKPEMPDPQTDMESLENPDFFKNELLNAGFREVELHPAVHGFETNSVEEFWNEMVRASVPVAMMKKSMSPEEWNDKEGYALEYLHNKLKPLPITLTTKAWIGYGLK